MSTLYQTPNHARQSRCRSWPGLLALVALLLGAAQASAASLIDFEALPVGTTLSAQFGPSGVIFQSGYVDADAAAHSGQHIARTYGLNAEVFTPTSFGLTFTSAQAQVLLFAGSYFAAANATLLGYDAQDNVVAQDGPRALVADAYHTEFRLEVPTPRIVRLELRPDTTADLGIDDLAFDGDPPPPPPDKAPVITFTEPLDGSDLDTDAVGIVGVVTGEGLLPSVELTIAWHYPPETTAPPYGSTLDLFGSGNARQFVFPAFSILPLGPIEITVEATNTANLTGGSTITINNLPAAIRKRMAAEQAPFGEFGFGLTATGCKIAIYDSGAISLDPDGTTHVFRGDILEKWLSLRGEASYEGLGCPLEEQRDGVGGSLVPP